MSDSECYVLHQFDLTVTESNWTVYHYNDQENHDTKSSTPNKSTASESSWTVYHYNDQENHDTKSSTPNKSTVTDCDYFEDREMTYSKAPNLPLT
jgi:hypothetical protein